MDVNRVAELRKLYKETMSTVDMAVSKSIFTLVTAIPELLDEIVILQGENRPIMGFWELPDGYYPDDAQL